MSRAPNPTLGGSDSVARLSYEIRAIVRRRKLKAVKPEEIVGDLNAIIYPAQVDAERVFEIMREEIRYPFEALSDGYLAITEESKSKRS